MTKQLILSDADYIISDVSIANITPNLATESANGKMNAKSRGLHRLEIDFNITLANADDVKSFTAFMLKARGRLNPFKLSLQDNTDGKGHCNPLHTPVSPMLALNVATGSNQISLSGFSGTIPAGSYFQFPNDSKVHVILDDARPNQSVEIFPSARINHEYKQRLNFSPEPLVRLKDDEFSLKLEPCSEIKLTVKEVL
ncbi:hypothetical protein KGV31_002173 [Vibrio parahaemolyticus]|nr:hypothetical protein [Vibrio parahaemolyticus]EHU0344316.1 hypothetical protein [Vibrio parahaemolyticus]EHU0354350.1 hypothetical protein [Vibrio parahaemolyticus]